MAEVKWIKITTDIFDDEKILLIESLPDSYAIITVWFKLLCLAGKMNNSGVFIMSNRVAYTDKMLATIFRMKETTVTMALQTFEQFGMIEIIDGVITIPNWGKHQSLDQLESKKEYMRNYMQEYRAKQKLLTSKPNGKSNSKSNVSEADKDIDKELDTDIEIDNKNDIALPRSKSKPKKHKYGEYQNVLLTDDEYQKLQEEYSDYEERIDRLSSYVASSGKSYKSHYATIRNWAKKDQTTKPAYKQTVCAASGRVDPIALKQMQQRMSRQQLENSTIAGWEEKNSKPQKTAGNNESVRERAEQLKRQLNGCDYYD